MPSFRLIPLLLLLIAANARGADWAPTWTAGPPDDARALFYAKRTAVRASDGQALTAHLAFFSSPAYRLKVVDLGAGKEPKYATLTEAFRAEGCLAGVNGGFFHADWRPVGLMVSDQGRTNALERTKLLSGLIYSDAHGVHLLRRGLFRDHAGITALLQTGPYLVDAGRGVRGLSRSKPDPRTFIATDWRGHWVLGATASALSLAELADALASPGALTAWRIDRAINLDGGSSTGFFFDRSDGERPVVLKPWKRVRNLLGVAKR
ncbi:phosphodiester glycosidase family protein [Thiocystis violacea]|uniref:phosphodiester glycosidase family protein n=1 Tax=Thiocystis violacea TaxID=13725 RepID=UPI0019082DA3|nr:phosphodiester glycosidase family protein [Thiocystis violacea]MBK1723136.1 hypothetical protein [Thiocystis violacea]